MRKELSPTSPDRTPRAAWTTPTLTRLEAGRAELTIGTPFDGSNKS